MPVDPSTVTTWSSLTRAINEAKRPLDFIKNTVYGASEAKETRDIELHVVRRGRKMAPFVKRNGSAILVESGTEGMRKIMPAHIRIKKPMNPSDLMNNRRAGTVIHPGADGINEAMQAYLAREQGYLLDDVMNAEEWMAAQALRGTISYEDASGDAFEVDFGRAAAHDITLTSGDRWDQTGASVVKTFDLVEDLVSDAVSLNISDAIMSPTAADAFIQNAEVKELLDNRRFLVGNIDITQQIREDGARFLGTYRGVRCWRYGRSITLPDGTSEQLIRDKFVEFVANSPAAEFVTYYGAIEDFKALGDGTLLASQRFSKVWEQEDPSARMMLVESNPLPVSRRPDATVSVQVIS